MVILAAFVLFISAALLVRQRFRLRVDEAVLFGSVLAFLEVVLFMQGLGLASRLRPLPTWLATLSCIAINLFIAFWRCPLRPFKRTVRFPPFLWPAMIGAGLTAGLRLWLAWKIPPEGWDGLTYHLPIVVKWVQKANFSLAGWATPQGYFAWNGELASTWLALLGGSLDYAKLVQVLSLPLFAASGAVLGRRLAGLRWSWPAAIALPALPIVLIQAGLAYVDALYAAFWLAAAAAAIGLARSGRAVYAWSFAAAFGLAMGTKSTVYFMAPLLLLVFVGYLKSPRGLKPALGHLPLGLVLIILAGAGAYIRNFVLTGNPIFPFGFSIAGLPVLKGIYSTAEMPAYVEHWFVPTRWAWVAYPFWEKFRGVAGYTHLNGFGPLFALGWLLLPLAFGRAWKRRDVVALAFLGLFPLVLLFFFTLQPVQLPRYIIFLAPLPVIGLAYSLSRARGFLRRAVCVVWTAAILGGCCGVIAYVWRSPGPRWAAQNLISGKAVDAWGYYERQYSTLGRAARALDKKLHSGDLVAINNGELQLPWFGLPPRARVQEVILGECPYPQCVHGATAEEWIAGVDRLAARFVVVWSPAWNRGREDELRRALAERPARFERIGRFESPNFGWIEIFERTHF